jgi:hypothetical protein
VRGLVVVRAFRIVLAVGLAAACGTSPKSPPATPEQQSSAPEIVVPIEAGELAVLPGTRVAVPVPAGFVRKPGALGLIHERTEAVIMAREMRPIEDVGLDPDAMPPGFTILSEEDVVVGGLHGNRWEFVDPERTTHAIGVDFGDHEGSYLVIAFVPAEARASVGADISHALLGTQIDSNFETHFGEDFHAILPREHELAVRTVQTKNGPVEHTTYFAEATDGVVCELQVTRYSPKNLARIRPEHVYVAVLVGLTEDLDAELLGEWQLTRDRRVINIDARQIAQQRHLVVRYFFTGETLVRLLVSYPIGPEPAVVRTLIEGLLPDPPNAEAAAGEADG